MKLEFGILGPLEVRADGEPVRLGGIRQRALLAIFLLHPNRVLSRERLVDLVWGDEAPDSAVNALQVHLSQLRRVLEPARLPGTPDALLVNRPSGYMLAIEPDQLDVHRFESLAQQGRRALTGGEPWAAVDTLHAALAIWRGPALADFSDALFAVGARTRLEELRLSTLEDRIQADLAIGLHSEVVGELEALLIERPLRERLAGELMLSLYRCGRQAEATEVYHQTRRRLVESLGLEPGPDLQSLLRLILEQDPALDLKSPSAPVVRQKAHSLPMHLTSFIGRQQDIELLKDVLRRCRLVSLVGPGGVGKTRLALRVATRLHDAYPGGVCLIDLTPVASGDLVAQRALAALGFEEQGGTSPIDTIVRRLATQQVLLVLDNCEHVVEAASEFALALLERCPDLTLLVTSRERLNIPGERVWRVDPLSVPLDDDMPSLTALMDFEAVQLFVDRAQAGERRFALTPANAAAVAQLCRRLDGLPLALELAAANCSFATPRDMLMLADAQAWVPARPPRGTHPRQQTLQAALDWSHRLLSGEEQLLLRRLSVFADPFTFQAVEQVCADGRLPRSQIPTLLSALADKSLVAVHEAPDGASRYRLLYTVRQYASAKLVESGEAVDDIRRRHARHLLWLALASADAVHGPDADAWMRRMEEVHADLTAALAWSQAADPGLCLRLAAASALFWEDRGYLTEGRRWLDVVLGLADVPSSIQAAAWLADGRLALLQNDLVSAQARLKRGLTAADLAQDEAQVASMLRMLGLVAALMGDRLSAVRWQQQSLEIVERLADNEELANTLHTLGQTARVLHKEQAAHAYHTRCLAVARILRNHRLAALANLNLGTLALRRGELELAETAIRASLEIWSWLGGRLQATAAVAALALVIAERGDADRALRLVSAAVAFGEQIGTSLERTARFWFGDDLAARVERIRRRLGPLAAATAWEQGHAMSLDDAIAQTAAREAIAVR
jgi:predicted ATPase/DNA-binding SARP family transcriptional activator